MTTWDANLESQLQQTDLQQAEKEGPTLANMTTVQAMQAMTTVNDQSQAQFEQIKALINELLLSKVQTLRTMHVTIGAIGIALALLMVVRIIRQARKISKLQVPLRPKRFSFLRNIHTGEVFPLALAFSIVVQQLVFVAVQSTAVNSVLVDGCSRTAQVVFPALFLLGYTAIVFGMETTIRSLKARRFDPRGRRTTSICAVSIAILSLFTWIPSAVWRSPDRCFGNLVWFPINLNIVAISIISTMLFLLLSMGAIIALQLLKSVRVDDAERVAASIVCYFIFLTAFIYLFVLPFFIQALLRNFDSGLTTSRIAELSLFSSGIIFIVFYQFLGVNATRMTIKPLGVASGQKRRRIRFFGPSDIPLTISGPILSPSPDRDDLAFLVEKNEVPSSDFYSSLEKVQSPLEGLPSPNKFEPATWPLPPVPLTPKTTAGGKRIKSTYSIFPSRAEDIPRLPATVYLPPSPRIMLPSRPSFLKRANTASEVPSVTDVSAAYEDELAAPAPLFANRHRRDSSGGNSATVQIGLRLSVAPAAIAAANVTMQNRQPQPRRPALPAHPAVLRRNRSDSSDNSLGLPIQKTTDAASPAVEKTQEDASVALKSETSQITPQNSGEYLQQARDKVLPPIPRASGPPPGDKIPSGLRMNPISPMSTITASTSSLISPPANAATRSSWI